MKLSWNILSICLLGTIVGFPISSVQAATVPDMPGTCEFYTGNKLKIKQACGISRSSDSGSQLTTLFWEDGEKTNIKILDNLSSLVDGTAAENSRKGDRVCYQFNKGDRVCYEISRKSPIKLAYGCGADCGRVRETLITNVRRSSHKIGGKNFNSAVFLTRVNGIGKYQHQSSHQLSYVYASCNDKKMGSSFKYGEFPSSFETLSGTQDDYITALQGRGYRFDVLCK